MLSWLALPASAAGIIIYGVLLILVPACCAPRKKKKKFVLVRPSSWGLPLSPKYCPACYDVYEITIDISTSYPTYLPLPLLWTQGKQLD